VVGVSAAGRDRATPAPSAEGPPALRARAAHHFGPDPAYVGGIGSVMRVLAEHSVGATAAEIHPTWRSDAPLASLPLALRTAFRAIPRITEDDVCHVHLAENGSFVREGAVVALASLRGRTTVVTIHGADFLPFARRHPRLAATVLRRADLITCLDGEVLELVSRMAPRTEAHLLPNPVAVDDGSPPADETAEVVLFAGEIGLRKGADVLLKAWRLVAKSRPAARCVMVGPLNGLAIPETERLEVREPVAPEAMGELLHGARAVALPSRSEGMPMILTEAMSAGRPFVSTPVGGIPELARGGGGLLVPVEDHLQLAVRLTELLEDRALARDVGERGRSFCRQTRGVGVIDARLRQLYAAAARG
jgi:glycosyltransferase involved in cell wall biosynthesis